MSEYGRPATAAALAAASGYLAWLGALRVCFALDAAAAVLIDQRRLAGPLRPPPPPPPPQQVAGEQQNKLSTSLFVVLKG